MGYKIRYKQGYFPVPPADTHQDLRTEMMLTLEQIGVDVEVQHHEVGTAGQAEIDMRFDSLVSMGDKLLKYKYAVKNVARRHGKTVTLMPKPIFQDNGSGMHVHQSIWKDGRNQFFEAGTYADLSQTALYYIGGLLKHAPALLRADEPDHQLLPAAGAGLRGAHQPDLLDAQPQRRGPHPGLLDAARRRSGSSAASPTRPATATSRSARC